jgi:ubiquitin carboxyl-terminal hydrolase 36/42
MYVQDAIGRWYRCNDSFVSLSTLQEVLSEKVYILFFSRTNQRPASASTASTALALNGTKSSDCNGSEAFSSTKAALPPKAVHAKAYFEQSSQNDISTISKVVEVTSSPQVSFSIGNSNSKRAPATGNGRVDVHKSPSMETNGDEKHSICSEKSGKDVASSMMVNGFNRTRKVGAADSKCSKGSTLTSENGNSQTGDFSLVKPDHGEGNCTRSRVTRGGPAHDELETCGVHDRSQILGSKRKSELEGSCILFAQDAQSQAEVEELKEVYVSHLLYRL